MIMDLPVFDAKAWETAVFFCKLINRNGCDIKFTYNPWEGFAWFIRTGSEDQAADFMKAYYER